MCHVACSARDYIGIGLMLHCCVVYPRSGELGGQRFFFGHDNDVCALAIHPDGETVVSGQIGRDAKIIVWCVICPFPFHGALAPVPDCRKRSHSNPVLLLAFCPALVLSVS